MKIFFLNPPFRDQHFSRSQRSPGVIKSGTMYYPYWLAHAAALVEQEGHEIHLLDAPADGRTRDEVVAEILRFEADLVVSETSTPSHRYDLGTLEEIRRRCGDALPKLKLCMVGTHATSEWEKVLDGTPAVDFVAVGEYDHTVLELANALDASRETESQRAEVQGLAQIAALALRDENGQAIRGPARLPLEDMDSLPWIAPIYKRFLNVDHYCFTIATHPMVMLIGGRGCPAKCFYCVYPQVMHGHKYRVRSPEHLVGEMKWIQENMPEVREIVFEDDTFTGDRKWAREVARLVKENGVRLPWFANIRTNTDHETLKALHESGLRECATGFESGDDLLLLNMRKGQNVEKQLQFMESCRDLGILVHGCFMVGFPGETQETMEKTLDLAIRLDPDSAQFYPVMPYPGTGAYQWAKDNGYLATEDFEEWLTAEGGHRCVLNLPDLTPQDLESFCESAFRRFHFRPRYIARKLAQAVTNPREGIRSVSAGGNFIKYLFTNKRKTEEGFRSQRLETAESWHTRTRVPHGRMERMDNVVKQAKKKGASPMAEGELDQALVGAEAESQR